MLQPGFQPFPELRTGRLLLRKMTSEDAPEVFFLRSDETVLQFVKREPVTSVKEAQDFIDRINREMDAGESILWAIAMQEDPARLIGTICYWRIQKEHARAEIGFLLHPHSWRKGIMKEAVLKVIEYGFTVMQLHSIEGRIDPDNIASAAVLESTGFVREGYFKEDFFFKGQFMDTAVYSRLR